MNFNNKSCCKSLNKILVDIDALIGKVDEQTKSICERFMSSCDQLLVKLNRTRLVVDGSGATIFQLDLWLVMLLSVILFLIPLVAILITKPQKESKRRNQIDIIKREINTIA